MRASPPSRKRTARPSTSQLRWTTALRSRFQCFASSSRPLARRLRQNLMIRCCRVRTRLGPKPRLQPFANALEQNVQRRNDEDPDKRRRQHAPEDGGGHVAKRKLGGTGRDDERNEAQD